MWIVSLAFFALGLFVRTQYLELVWNKIELVKNIWTFILECPKWIYYHEHVDENVQTLERKMETLCCLEDDVNSKLQNEELSPRNKRKREVDNWLTNVERLKSNVHSLEQNVRETYFLLRAWYGSRVEKHIKEVNELIDQGRFPEGLVIESSQTRGEALLTTTLVGTQERTLENIWAYVMNDEVLRIGVLGLEGIGKTSIISHINNRLIESHNFDHVYDHVYWVTVSSKYTILELQSEIAQVIRLDFLDEKDEMKRAARLHHALLKRRKTLLILDGLSKYLDPDKIGISTQVNGCKLILTTRSPEVCRKMGCREIIEVGRLRLDEAETLFIERLGFNDLCASEIAKLIVKECDGLPLSIVNMAERLRGVNDIAEWRNTLNEMRESKKNKAHDD